MTKDERRSARSNVILRAEIQGPTGFPVRVRVSNLSANGALVIGEGLPSPETSITFHCNGQAIDSWLIWSEGDHSGIQFVEPALPETLTQREKHQPTLLKDTRDADFRRPGFKGMSEEERKAVERWKRELGDDELS